MQFKISFLLIVSWVLFGFPVEALAQQKRPFHIQKNYKRIDSPFLNDTTLNKKRRKAITGVALGAYAGLGLYLGTSWYANEDLGAFHFFDDSREWKQIDKLGHAMGSYNMSRLMIDLFKWSGEDKKKAVFIGGASGFLAMTSVEVFDGFGETWGFSWSDVGANFTGSSVAVANQLLWNENRIQVKVGYQKSPYANVDSLQYLFGSNPAEWFLKDYNGHTLWLSFRVHSFLPEGKFKDIYPRWLNLAVGYGAEGLEGRYNNEPWASINAREYRQYYLGLDVDLANIKTRSGFLNALFSTINLVRIPFPALRFDKNGMKLRIE